MKSFVVITAFVFLVSHYLVKVSPQIILEVPGYGVLNGTTESSSDTERPFYAFRSVYYAEMPTPENRFLVSASIVYNNVWTAAVAIIYFDSHRFQNLLTRWTKSNKLQPITWDALNLVTEMKIVFH